MKLGVNRKTAYALVRAASASLCFGERSVARSFDEEKEQRRILGDTLFEQLKTEAGQKVIELVVDDRFNAPEVLILDKPEDKP